MKVQVVSKIGFLFPGQGAQHVGMTQTICEKYPAAKALFDKANEILGYDLADLCFNGPAEKLDSTVISQPAIFTASLAALEMLKADAPETVEKCEMTAGLSLGEYTALTFAGAISFEDGLRLVQQRGQAMQDAADATASGMVSLLLIDTDKVEELCQQASEAGQIQIANLLCPGNTVVSGVKSACEKIVELAEGAGGRAVSLTVAGAFHTSIMEPADSRLKKVLAATDVNSPRIPVVSNVDASTHTDPDEIRSLLVKQVVSPVLWEKSIRKMLDDGVDEFYEIGPGKVLRGLMKRINRKISCSTVNDS